MNKNILFIIDSLGGGGAERVVLTLARTMCDLGHRITIVSIDNIFEYNIDFPATIKTLNFYKLKWRSTYRYFGKKLKKLITALESDLGPFDLITAHLQKAHRLTKRAGIKNTFYCIHTTMSQGNLGTRKGLRLFIKRRKLKFLLNGTNIVSVSKGIATDLIDDVHIKPNTLRTIYNPLDFAQIRSLAQLENPFAGEDYIIQVGRLTDEKRHDILLKAYASTNIKSKLIILGKGPLLSNLLNLAKQLSISDRVIFAGFHKNPYPIIKGAKLFVLSSDYEGLPTVLIESLILNVPAVSTDCRSGPKEILKGDLSQFLAPTNNPSALATTMQNAFIAIENGTYIIDENLLQEFNAEHACKQYLALAG